MKDNKAPEKIYVKITHPISDEYSEIIAFEDGDGIEYTRSDEFIEKALEWIRKEIRPYYSDVKYKYENFKKYMEEKI